MTSKIVSLEEMPELVSGLGLLDLYKKNAKLVIGLSGELGAGKTTLSQAIIHSLGGVGVSSPSFAIVNHYEIDGVIVRHYDLYRVGSVMELLEIDFFSEIETGITIIEWASKFDIDLDISIELEEYKNKRKITWRCL